MDKMWAPWRIGYILSDKKEDGCVLCNAYNASDDKKYLVLCRSEHSFVIMNKYPYNAGHIMIVPNRHVDTSLTLSKEEQLDIFEMVNRGLSALKNTLHPDGFNLGMNFGRVAGAGIDDHIHIHIVPRWNGDTNFMSTVSDVKVVSESIKETYEKIKNFLENKT